MQTTPNASNETSNSVTALVRGLLLTLLLFLALRNDVIMMLGSASTFSEWSHAWVVPVLIALFISLRRHELITALRPPSFWGLLFIFAGLFLWMAANSLGLFGYLRLLAIPLALVGIVLLVAGRRVLFIMLPTIIMVGSCLPLDERSMNRFSIPVQSISVKLAAKLLNIAIDQPVRAADREIVVGQPDTQLKRIGQGEQRFGFRLMPVCACLAMFVIFAPPRTAGIKILMTLALPIILPLANVARVVIWVWFDPGSPTRLDESTARNLSAIAAIGTTFVCLLLVAGICKPILGALANFFEVEDDETDQSDETTSVITQRCDVQPLDTLFGRWSLR